MVYSKLAYFNSSPAVAYWFTFWHDAWWLNRDSPAFRDNKRELDPAEPDALCYTPLSRDALEQKLTAMKLRSAPGCCGAKKGWFSDALLDRFFQKLETMRQLGGFVEHKESALLTASGLDLARRSARVNRPAGAALLPYAAWCGFATVLSAAIARRNRRS